MATLHEEKLTITLSKISKRTDPPSTQIADRDFTISLEHIIQELVGENVLIEIEDATITGD